MREIDIRLLPEQAHDAQFVHQAALQAAGLKPDARYHSKVLKRSIDARGKQPVFQLQVGIFTDEPAEPVLLNGLHDVSDAPKVNIVGTGPAGYFAALDLIELGYKPVLLDRGKDVRARRRDLKAIQQDGIVSPHSNYCFGEGGAGTYSDGKLYTRSHKRGDMYKVLKLLVEHGANSDILIDAHPHIGSNKLPQVVAAIRATIEHYGGEVHFNSFVTDFVIRHGRLTGVLTDDGRLFEADATILATGHSARDIYFLLDRLGLQLEAKPFALGVRIEHPQQLIDSIQYKRPERGALLPAASYKLVCQIEGEGVFSFCMCPGGLVVPAATAPGEIVVNGMSMSRRDSKYANSGTVVSVDPHHWPQYAAHGVFAGLVFQQEVEQAMFAAGQGGQQAPAQRLTDFVQGKMSASLSDSSYIPGLFSAPLHNLLPRPISAKLRAGVQQFGKQMRGYYTEEANVIGVESRTSSPVRIPRDPTTRMHPQLPGLFPCGEGAGYAGGILSAAMDGQNVAHAVAAYYKNVTSTS
jgi:uncharacterized FAD-dependent dehydrogenase